MRAELVQLRIRVLDLSIVHLMFLYHDRDLRIWIKCKSMQMNHTEYLQVEKFSNQISNWISHMNLATLLKKHSEFTVEVIFQPLLHLPKSRDWM